MESAAKAKANARPPSWAQILKALKSPRVATVPYTVRDFCRLQAGSLAPNAQSHEETSTRRSRAPKPRAPIALNSMTGLPPTLAPMMSTLAFSAGPPGIGALPAYEDAQTSLLIAAEDAGVPLPKHALLTSGDWTIVVQYAATPTIS